MSMGATVTFAGTVSHEAASQLAGQQKLGRTGGAGQCSAMVEVVYECRT